MPSSVCPVSSAEPELRRLAELLGLKVRTRREELDLTQEALALQIGMERKSLQNIEYGRASVARPDGSYAPGNPKLDTIFRLSVALDLDIGYLVDPGQPVTP